MEKFLDKLRSNSLLIKILSVMLLSVVCVATLTLSISIRASEDVYVDTFTQSNSQIIGQIRENMSRFNDEIFRDHERGQKSTGRSEVTSPVMTAVPRRLLIRNTAWCGTWNMRCHRITLKK